MTRWTLPLVTATLVAVSCDSREDGSLPSKDARQASPATADADPAPTSAPATDVVDAAFFLAEGGVVALTDDGFSLVPESNYISSFRFGADGKLYGRGSAIVSISTAKATELVEPDTSITGSISDFDVSASGDVWVLSNTGVSVYRGGSWTHFDNNEIGLDSEMPAGITLDANGEPWAATRDRIVRRKGDAWEPVNLPDVKTENVDGLRRGTDGQLYATSYVALFRLSGSPGKVDTKMLVRDFAFSQSTYGAVYDDESVSIFIPVDKAADYGKEDLAKVGAQLWGVAVDEQGRIWASGQAGVVIVGPGDARAFWPTGSIDELDKKIYNFVVRGKGPNLPEVGAVKKGSLRGHIEEAGQPVAHVELELCPSPAPVASTGTPCSSAGTVVRGKTDSEGNFTIEDVPLADYGLAIRVDGGWAVTTFSSLGAGKMKANEMTDVGTIELK